MAARRTRYKQPGGVLGFPRQVLRSPAYRDLPLAARCLMLELQNVWQPSEPEVHFSVRRAAVTLGISMSTASRAFIQLIEHGFIRNVGASNWIEGQARTYVLTWLPNNGREPSNDWQNWSEN